MQDAELLLAGHAGPFGDEEAELTEDVGRHPDSCLVTTAGADGNKKGRCGISLQVALGMVGNDLDDAVPDGVGNVIAGGGDELQDGVNVPAEVGGILLGEDGNLEDHLLPDGGVSQGEVGDELVDDALGIVGIAHNEEEVEGTTADGDVGILEGNQDGGLVLLDTLGGSLDLGQAGHGHEAKVADVWLPDRDELAEELHGPIAELDGSSGTPANDEVDGLEENGMVGVGLVDGVGNVGLGKDLGNDGG